MVMNRDPSNSRSQLRARDIYETGGNYVNPSDSDRQMFSDAEGGGNHRSPPPFANSSKMPLPGMDKSGSRKDLLAPTPNAKQERKRSDQSMSSYSQYSARNPLSRPDLTATAPLPKIKGAEPRSSAANQTRSSIDTDPMFGSSAAPHRGTTYGSGYGYGTDTSSSPVKGRTLPSTMDNVRSKSIDTQVPVYNIFGQEKRHVDKGYLLHDEKL